MNEQTSWRGRVQSAWAKDWCRAVNIDVVMVNMVSQVALQIAIACVNQFLRSAWPLGILIDTAFLCSQGMYVGSLLIMRTLR
jgi:hypothetical protein